MTKMADRYQEAHKLSLSGFSDRQVRKDGQRKPFDRSAKGNEDERSVSELNRTCYKCGKKGHIAIYCKSKANCPLQTNRTAGLRELKSETSQNAEAKANGDQILAACVELNAVRYEYRRPPGTY